MAVVVVLVLAQHGCGVLLVNDQGAVEKFAMGSDGCLLGS
jgi:hypothetical protein